MQMETPNDPGFRREYPPHGTVYRSSGRVGNFWWTVPVIVVAAVVLGLAVPTSADLLGLEDGPTALLTARGWKRIGLVQKAVICAYILCGLVPGFLVGLVVGWSSALAHTRSRIAIAIGAADAALAGGAVALLGMTALQERLACEAMKVNPLPGDAECLGRVLADPSLIIRHLSASEYALVATFVLGVIVGAFLGVVRFGRGFLYDEVAGRWYDKPVRIPRDFGTVEGRYTADTLRAPPVRSADPSATWVQLYLHPTLGTGSADGPARELVSARRVGFQPNGKRAPKRFELPEMPPTFVDRAVVEALMADASRG